MQSHNPMEGATANTKQLESTINSNGSQMEAPAPHVPEKPALGSKLHEGVSKKEELIPPPCIVFRNVEDGPEVTLLRGAKNPTLAQSQPETDV